MPFIETIFMALLCCLGALAVGAAACIAIFVGDAVYAYVKQYYTWITHRTSLRERRNVRRSDANYIR